jgi:hypothetical protein
MMVLSGQGVGNIAAGLAGYQRLGREVSSNEQDIHVNTFMSFESSALFVRRDS